MISSGIKRGVAATAVSALAVAGVPLLATSASAEPTDEIQFVSAGPTLDGGTVGGEIKVKLKGITEAELDSDLTVFNPALTDDDADTPTQTVLITDTSYEYVANGAAGDSNPNDGFAEATVLVAVDTPTPGSTATYALVVDDNNDGTVQSSEARTQVSQQTSGPLDQIEVAPATQSAPQNVESDDYVVTLKDSAGRTTQLDAGEVVNLAPNSGTVTLSDNQFDEFELVDGSEAFTATGSTSGSYTIAIDSPDYTGEETSAGFTVTEAANLDAGEIDIVTAADSWDGFGGGTDGGTTLVRVDQNTIRFDFNTDPNQPGANVRLEVDGTDVGPGNGVTFGGQPTAVYNTTLDANGNGSITVTADAATVQEGDTFEVDINNGDFTQTIEFDRAEQDDIQSASDPYFCQDDADCTVTAVVTDQFGNPVTTGEVEASRTGPQNNDATPQRKPVGADGTVDFTFTDTNPVDGGTDTVLFEYFLDQFDNSPEDSDTATIQYSATGQGSDFVISLDGENTEGAGYDADDAAVIPLWDTVANTTTGDDDEDAVITIANGEGNQAVTLSVDNGALILTPGETRLSQGSASVDTNLVGGVLPAGYRIIGTTSGLVTLTVDSANRTETAQLTVKAQDDEDSARNVTLSSPATVPAGTNQITFTAVVTDAFGNPVSGVSNSVFNKVVTGPGQYQDGDAETDENGVLNLNVDVDDNASGDVTLTLNADNDEAQFGADEDRLTADSNTDDGEGLSESSDVASSTTTVEGETGPNRVAIDAVLKGRNTGADTDKLKVVTTPRGQADGARVNLFRFNENGVRELMESSELNANGIKRFQVPDINGMKKTKYVARIKRTDDSKAVKRTNFKRVR